MTCFQLDKENHRYRLRRVSVVIYTVVVRMSIVLLRADARIVQRKVYRKYCDSVL